MAWRIYLFPFRTQKSSSIAPRVVGGSPPVRVGRCHANYCVSHYGWRFFTLKSIFDTNEQKPLFLLFLWLADESYVITKNYESRKKSRFCLELNEMPSNAIGLRITFINWSIQEFIQIYGQTANLWWFVRNRQRFYKMQRPLNQCSKNLPTASSSKIYSKKTGLDLQLIANHPGVKFEEYFFTSLVQWFFC